MLLLLVVVVAGVFAVVVGVAVVLVVVVVVAAVVVVAVVVVAVVIVVAVVRVVLPAAALQCCGEPIVASPSFIIQAPTPSALFGGTLLKNVDEAELRSTANYTLSVTLTGDAFVDKIGMACEPCDDPVEGRNRSGEPQREPWTPRSASSLIGENWGVAGPSGVVIDGQPFRPGIERQLTATPQGATPTPTDAMGLMAMRRRRRCRCARRRAARP